MKHKCCFIQWAGILYFSLSTALLNTVLAAEDQAVAKVGNTKIMMNEIKRGEIYCVDWNPARGSEQSGLRPALVVQNDVGNTYSPTTIVAALTTAITKPYPFTVKITAKESGLPKDSTINLAVIMTIDKTRLIDKCGELTESKMDKVNEAIKASLGM